MRQGRHIHREPGVRLAIAGLAGIALVCGASPVRSQEARVDLNAYDIEGNTLLDPTAVEAAVYPYLGPQRSREDVETARATLEKTYHDKGFQSVVVEVPPQTVTDGVVRFKVLEAAVGRLRVTGADYFSPEEIRRGAPSLREGAAPNLIEAQRELNDLNRLGDRQVTPVVKAGRVPGTLDVELQVADKLPLHFSVDVSNDHARDTPDFRATSTVSYGNLWQRGHTASLTYSVAPEDPDASEVLAGSYLAPVWGSPWNVLVYGYRSNSDVVTLGSTNVLGKGYAIGFRGIRQLQSLGAFSQSLTLGADFKHFDQEISLGGIVLPPVAIDYVPVTASYSIQSGDEVRGTRLTLGVTAGIRGLGDDTAAFLNNRFKARPNFVRLTYEYSHRQPVGGGSLLLRGSGQLADQPLLSGEQFAIGGLNSVRGYLQSEAVGDTGAFTSIELTSPLLLARSGGFVDNWRVYVFVDGGALKVLEPTPDQDDFLELYSFGFGTRFDLRPGVQADLGVGFPMIDTDATETGKARAILTVKSEF